MSDMVKYPEKLICGDYPSKQRAINHYCDLKLISALEGQIGPEAYEDIKNNSQLGVILKFADSGHNNWSSKFVQYLLFHMLDTASRYEVWVLVDGRPIRFSLQEFEQITRLKCGLPESFERDNEKDGLWREMGMPANDGPTWPEIKTALGLCKKWPRDSEKRKMMGLLVVLHVAIYGKHYRGRIPGYLAKLVMYPEIFERYPWGRVAFEVLVTSIRSVSLQAQSYTLQGFVQVLLVWALELIPPLGEMCGGRSEGEIPLLRWLGRIPRGLHMEKVYETDKTTSADKKVRVLHMMDTPEGEVCHVWPNDVEDPKVDNMVRDIRAGTLDESFWAVPASSKREATEQDHRPEKRSKKKKGKATESTTGGKEDERLAVMFKKNIGDRREVKAKWERKRAKENAESGRKLLIDMVQSVNKTLDVFRTDQISIAQRVGQLEAIVKCQQDERAQKKIDDEVVERRLSSLEFFCHNQSVNNDRLARLLERWEAPLAPHPLALEGVKASGESCGSEARDRGDGKGNDADGSGQFDTVRRPSSRVPENLSGMNLGDALGDHEMASQFPGKAEVCMPVPSVN